MIEDTIARIRLRVANSRGLEEGRKRELEALLERLSAEVSRLDESRRDDIDSVRLFTEASAHEAMRDRQDPERLAHALNGLRSSVRQFEVSHPRLAKAVNAICVTLANLGI